MGWATCGVGDSRSKGHYAGITGWIWQAWARGDACLVSWLEACCGVAGSSSCDLIGARDSKAAAAGVSNAGPAGFRVDVVGTATVAQHLMFECPPITMPILSIPNMHIANSNLPQLPAAGRTSL